MKKLYSFICAAFLCSALAGCAHDYYGPPVTGSVAVGTGGVYAGSVSVGPAYYASPLIFPVLPPPRPIHIVHPRPYPYIHHGPAFRPGPMHRPPVIHHGKPGGVRPPVVRPGGPGHRPPAMHHGPRPGKRPPAVHSGGPRPKPQAVRPGGHGPGGGRPSFHRPGNPGRSSGHGMPRPR